ncbi:MAG: hypothetical protein D6788_00425 [Planctomycetota bacterium]|nr:MAG: hypothetical protein D6788_00425 [Planctomycetota bacterium]
MQASRTLPVVMMSLLGAGGTVPMRLPAAWRWTSGWGWPGVRAVRGWTVSPLPPSHHRIRTGGDPSSAVGRNARGASSEPALERQGLTGRLRVVRLSRIGGRHGPAREPAL